MLEAQLQQFHRQGKTHRQIDIRFRHILVHSFHKDSDADCDQKGQRENFYGRIVENELSDSLCKRQDQQK